MNASEENLSAETPGPAAILLRVDRSKALVRGLWRLAAASSLFWLLYVWDGRWEILWNTQKATFIGLGTLYLGIAGVALGLFFPGLKWMTLTCWPGRLRIDLSPTRLSLALGPFKNTTYEMSRLTISTDREIDPDLLELMPDDAFLTCVRTVDGGENLSERIQVFSGVAAEQLNALLRPYLIWKMNQA